MIHVSLFLSFHGAKNERLKQCMHRLPYTDCISDVLEEHLELSIPYHGMMKKDTFVSYAVSYTHLTVAF